LIKVKSFRISAVLGGMAQAWWGMINACALLLKFAKAAGVGVSVPPFLSAGFRLLEIVAQLLWITALSLTFLTIMRWRRNQFSKS
jgi:hypothetical protein